MKTYLNRFVAGAIIVAGAQTTAFSQFQSGGTGFVGTTTNLGGTQGFGQPTTGFGGTQGTTGFGGAGGAGATAGITSAPLNGPFGGPGVSGPFGGRGISGVTLRGQEFSTLNAANGVVVPSTTGNTAAGQQTGQNAGGFGTGGLGTTGFGGGLGGGLGNIGIVGRTGGLGGIGGLGGLGGNAGRNNANNSRAKIRTIVTPDINVERSSSAASAAVVQARMARIPIPERIANVKFVVENGEVVLRGDVVSEADKKFAERLVKLEPGVDSVKNELIVRGKAPERIQAVPSR